MSTLSASIAGARAVQILPQHTAPTQIVRLKIDNSGSTARSANAGQPDIFNASSPNIPAPSNATPQTYNSNGAAATNPANILDITG
jgi:hypothetical protein